MRRATTTEVSPPTTVKPRSFVEMCQCFGVTCCISAMAELMPSFLYPGYSCFHFVHMPVPELVPSFLYPGYSCFHFVHMPVPKLKSSFLYPGYSCFHLVHKPAPELMPPFLYPGYSCFHFVHMPVPIREHKNLTLMTS